MVDGVREEQIRAAALNWLSKVTLDGTVPVSRVQLRDDFQVDGSRFPLVDAGRGIRKPRGWSAALSILTAAPEGVAWRPYDDSEGPDGLHRYKLRRDEGGAAENAGLRAAMHQQAPLLWFCGIHPGIFQAIFPVYLSLSDRRGARASAIRPGTHRGTAAGPAGEQDRGGVAAVPSHDDATAAAPTALRESGHAGLRDALRRLFTQPP